MKVDRPIGSVHPKHKDMKYPINYGYIPDTLSFDGQEIDAYLLGVSRSITQFEGICIAVIHRIDDVEDKLVIAPQHLEFSDKEILSQTNFQEQYFKTSLMR